MAKKILYIQGVTRMGGAIESLLLLMENLNSENFLPLVVTSSEGKFTDELKKRKIGYEIVKMEMWRKAKGFLSRPFILKKLIDYAKKQSVSLIHCNTLWDNPYGSIIAKNLKIPLVCHIRNTFSYDKIKKYNLASADRIICVSQKVAESFNGWKYRDKVEIIYNGVDMNRFNPSKFVQSEVKEKFSLPPHSPLVGIVGRVSPQKGQLEVIRAAAIIKEKVPSIKVMIVGETSKKESEYLNFLKNEAENLGVSENVVFAGYRSNIAEITSAFDVAVFPSLEGANEGFGRSLIEAMAMKKPVVATLTGGIPEVVEDGKSGILVNPSDVKALSEAILKMLQDNNLRKNYIEEGYKRVQKRFSAESYIAKIETLYSTLL